MSDYDFTDPLIREMVDEHHKPKEVISVRNDGVVTALSVVCRQCGQKWPCSARQELNKHLDKELKEAAQRTAYPAPPRPIAIWPGAINER